MVGMEKVHPILNELCIVCIDLCLLGLCQGSLNVIMYKIHHCAEELLMQQKVTVCNHWELQVEKAVSNEVISKVTD